MARPSKLSPEQWAEIERRLAAGEGASALAREFGVNPSQVTRRVTQQSQKVREVAKVVAQAQTALAELPPAQQYHALSLAEKLRSISSSMASGAELAAKNFHRLSSLANTELQKVDDADLPASETSLRVVAGLTKMANDAATTPINLLNANKERIKEDPPDPNAAPLSGVLVVPGLAGSSEEWAKQSHTKETT